MPAPVSYTHLFQLAYGAGNAAYEVADIELHDFCAVTLTGIGHGDYGSGGAKMCIRDRLYSTYANIGKTRRASVSAYVNWNATPRTRIYMNTVSYTHLLLQCPEWKELVRKESNVYGFTGR